MPESVTESLILADSHLALPRGFTNTPCGRQCGAEVRCKALKPHGQGSNAGGAPGQVMWLCRASVFSSVEYRWSWELPQI